eukprot:TRINITY_DN111677_c0_g1_i1.p1 TRINITY_DN111677_c0_g1~~TRINITY_DN111677_c0_g1_i1.p1  ORF type:complete len:473 (-),score=75.65 TRINITY_DN111677_c0_g1_i1:279-1697(-)
MSEIKKRPLLWLVLGAASGMLILVNLIEQSFARTLISCNTPQQEGGLWSGSGKCGDRALVINEGATLSSLGQSQEYTAKILMMVTTAVLSEAYGRKPVLLLGLACTTLSVFLFLISTLADSWAHTLFVMGQGLQGAYPATLLTDLIVSDLASKPGEDRVAIHQAGVSINSLSLLVFSLLAFALQMLDLANYLPIWTLILLCNAGTLVAAYLYLPESKVLDDKLSKQRILPATLAELDDYKALLISYSMMRNLLFSFSLSSLTEGFSAVAFPVQMAYHNMTNPQVLAWFFPLGFVKGACIPWVGSLGKKHGYRAAWNICVLLAFFTGTMFFVIPLHWGALYLQAYMFQGLLSGMDGLRSSIESKRFGDRYSKYLSVKHLVKFGLNIVSAPCYAYLFDANSVTYLQKARPCLFAAFFCGINAVWVYGPSGNMPWHLETCDLLEVERQELEKASTDAATTPQDDAGANGGATKED